MNSRKRLAQVVIIALGVMAVLVGLTLPAQAAPMPGVVYRPNGDLTTSLVAFWTLDENNTNRADSVGGNTLTQTGGNLPSTTGVISNAAQFSSGNSYYLKKTDSASLSMGDIDFSIAGWINATATPPTDEVILAKSSAGTAATTEYLLYVEGGTGKLAWTVCNGSTCSAKVGPTLTVNTWYFFVVWHDASANTINIEVNNNGTIYSNSYSGGSFDSAAPFMIGRYDHSSTYHSELVDEVGIWKKVLTSDERTTLYNGGAGCTYPFSDCDPDGTVYTLTGIEDTWLDSNNPTINYGQTSNFYAGDASSGAGLAASRGIIRFNFDIIPPSAQVLSATLKLTSSGGSTGSGSRTIDMYLLKSQWDEDVADWTHRLVEYDSYLGGNVTRQWGTAGAGTLEQVSPSTASASVGTTSGTVNSFDVTTDVRKIVTGSQLNYGWVFQDRTEADGYIRAFYTSDEPTVAYRPVLEITFIDHSDATDANWLTDGNFEDSSAEWDWATAKRQNEDIVSYNNVGPAACGKNYAAIDAGMNSNTGQPTSLSQRFYWPGGTAYFHSFVRDNSNDSGIYVAFAQVARVDGTLSPVNITLGSSYTLLSAQWTQIQSAFYLSPGFYDILLGSDNPAGANTVADFAVDDLTLSLNSYMSYCDGLGGPTRTPYPPASATASNTPTSTSTAGPSPTATNTPALSATPTSTSTPAVVNGYGNCNFESGSTGWTGSNWQLANAGGPVGARYAIVYGTLGQQFNWNGGLTFVSFWVGPGSYGTVRLRSSYNNYTLHVAANPSAWQLRVASANIPAGIYKLEFLGYSSTVPILIDGALVSSNAFSYCTQSGTSNTAITPTSGATSFVTATSTNTPNTTLTATPSLTPSATMTPTKTLTPSATVVPPIYGQLTQQASINSTNSAILTQQANSQLTQQSQATATNNATAAAQLTQSAGVIQTLQAISTNQATQAAGGGQPQPTAMPNPPDQPPIGSGEPCNEPDNPLNLGWWTDYSICQLTNFFAWNDSNTEQLTSLTEMAASKEPFATINSFNDAIQQTTNIVSSIDWNATQPCEGDMFSLIQPASGVFDGNLNFEDAPDVTTVCTLPFESILGEQMNAGLCYVYNLLCTYGILQLLRWFFNLSMIVIFVLYIQSAWISKASA